MTMRFRRAFNGAGRKWFLTKILMAALIPVVLLVVLAFIPDLDDPLDPSETVQLGSTFAVFWLLMSLAPDRGVGGSTGGRLGGARPKLDKLGKGRRQPRSGAAGTAYLDGVGIHLSHWRVAGVHPASN